MGDEFEAREMHDGAPVVLRDKRVARWMVAMLAMPGLFTTALGVWIAFANATSHKPVPAETLPLVVATVCALGIALVGMGVVFGVLRTVVTERAVHVRYGLWGPTLPLESIDSCAVVDYDWTEFGGWGIRRGKGGTWAYVPSSGRVLELRYTEQGKSKRVLVGTDDPDATAAAIRAAKARAAGPKTSIAGASPMTEPAEDEDPVAEPGRKDAAS
jgi:hypothetical protein